MLQRRRALDRPGQFKPKTVYVICVAATPDSAWPKGMMDAVMQALAGKPWLSR
jgi:hypothetical protein